MSASQLLAYRFGADSPFEGQLVGALERVESGGAIRVLDVLFAARAAETGELTAIALGAGSGAITSRLLAFRLDPNEQREATRRALEGADAEAVDTVAAQLRPGDAFAAVLLQHRWADALSDAVARLGGTQAAIAFVDASSLGEVVPQLAAALEASGEG
jgi:hypothetical protein